MFPLPSLTPGSESAASAPLPNWVHKSGGAQKAAADDDDEHDELGNGRWTVGRDQVQVGTWVDGPARGNMSGTSWVPIGPPIPLDNGLTHASKDFWDPVLKRRILWTWAQQPAFPSGVQAIPRELTYHAGLKQIVYSPVAEMAMLRNGSIDHLGTVPLPAKCHVSIKVSSASDTETAIAAAEPGQELWEKWVYCALIVWPLSYWIFNAITVLVVPLREAGWSGRKAFVGIKFGPDLVAAIDTTWGLASTMVLTWIGHKLDKLDKRTKTTLKTKDKGGTLLYNISSFIRLDF